MCCLRVQKVTVYMITLDKSDARNSVKISYLTQNLGPKTLMLLLFPNRRLKSVLNS
jgi:hypothetical protein